MLWRNFTKLKKHLRKRLFARLIPRYLKRELADTLLACDPEMLADASLVFSQEGEDLLLRQLFPEKRQGFFVDIGAHHPVRFSNTWDLYMRGWRGINIDATPGSMEPFKRIRPRDINLECAVSDSSESLTFHLFNEKALNTFDASLAEQRVKQGWERLGKIEVIPRPLSSILAEHCGGRGGNRCHGY